MFPSLPSLLALSIQDLAGPVGVVIVLLAIGLIVIIVKCYQKVEQGQALVRNGWGGANVSFSSMIVYPVLHKCEIMDISVKRIEIDRSAKNGLICQDNLRADIKVAFFVRVNKTAEDVLRVAMSVGCARASNQMTIASLFDAKFSEALKTVGKRFDFVELYNERDTFKSEILKVIGTDLNGFVLDDCAIDYLEQTKLEELDPENILDAEGIKKITELTAAQAKLANSIMRDKERVITQQDVEAREAILELNRQLAETEAKQLREVETTKAREMAETEKVRAEARLASERAVIAVDEELAIALENKQRQVLVAQRNKERTDAVEVERVTRDRELEVIERDRVTALKGIERDKAVEIEKKSIQDVIKERVMVEKTVVTEQQKIIDTEAFALAERNKSVAVTAAEQKAQEELIRQTKLAEAAKAAGQLKADQDAYMLTAALQAEETLTLAEAKREASVKEAEAKKMLADALVAETAAPGLGEAQVLEAQAGAIRLQGTAEAEVSQLKFAAEATGIEQKAQAMKLLEEAGRTHEEFKLQLEKEKAIALKQIDIQKDIAAQQAIVLGEALKQAKIDIVGGDAAFIDRITGAVGQAKAIDQLVSNSTTLSDIKDTFFNGDPEYFKGQFKEWTARLGVTSEDVKNLTVATAIGQIMGTSSEADQGPLNALLGAAKRFGFAKEKAARFLS